MLVEFFVNFFPFGRDQKFSCSFSVDFRGRHSASSPSVSECLIKEKEIRRSLLHGILNNHVTDYIYSDGASNKHYDTFIRGQRS
jgi:hypothetical protein